MHRPLPRFPDYYAGIDGTIVSGKTGRVLKASPNSRGRLVVTLMRSGKRHSVFVHQAIAEAYLGPRPLGLETMHMNGNETDNALLNLCYGTRSQNAQDAVIHGTHRNARKAKCDRGHEFTEANTITIRRKEGRVGRNCRSCHNLRRRRPRKMHD